jgi:prepilin-type N-terminal cleavage/methylation domain-containing protein
MSTRRNPSRAFTLIELLVVVAIIALLISVLLPTLSRAKEQARIGKCLANLRSITQAGAGYVMEERSAVFALPWDCEINGEPTSHNLSTEFIWGGGMPDARRAEWDETQGDRNPCDGRTDTYVVHPIDRPMNKYFDPDVTWSDPERIKGNAQRYNKPMDLPEYFMCPSDKSAAVPMVGASEDPTDTDTPYETWKWWGTSYPINWYWAYFYMEDLNIYVVGYTNNPGILDGPWHKKILASKENKGAAEWIFFYENMMNFALEGARPRGYPQGDPRLITGWHRQENTHAAGFLDGHATYGYFDTRTWPNREKWPGTMWEQYIDEG